MINLINLNKIQFKVGDEKRESVHFVGWAEVAIPGVEAGSGRLHPRHRLPQGPWGQDQVQISRTPCI